MRAIQYLQYFFYLGVNWNWRIACILMNLEIKGEKKYSINTTGADELKTLKQQGIDISHATMYMPVSYTLLEKALEQIPAENKNHFFDIGCGKGRAMCVAAHYGFKKVSGIDFSKDFCEAAGANLLITQTKIPAVVFSITHQNAVDTIIPPDTDCIFLFNPFDETIMKTVLQHIRQSLFTTPRKLHIIYSNPLYKSLFTQTGFKEIYHHKKLTYFEISILTNA